ncbi:hypothetical protein [Algivirga pacifica]|uniref:DUF3592 domain-containing protein n=1 Tax=Algivirga pacifica TaxID=1162670 RepID=A0ABP9DB18_9BACT
MTHATEYQSLSLHLSIKEKLQLIRKGASTSLVLLIFGITFSFTSGPGIQWYESLRLEYGKTGLVDATLEHKTSLGFNSQQEEIFQYNFIFDVDGTAYRGYSFSEHYNLDDPAGKVKAEFLLSAPAISRVVGTHKVQEGYFLSMMGLLPLIIGVLLMFPSFHKLYKIRYILKDAVVSIALLKDSKPTVKQRNNRLFYDVYYRYAYNGKSYTHKKYTNKLKKYQKDQVIFFSRSKPEKAVLLNTLPMQLQNKIRRSLAAAPNHSS